VVQSPISPARMEALHGRLWEAQDRDSLDRYHQLRKVEPMQRALRELGATALSITHDMASARKIADRIAMLYDGKIIWAGPTAEIDHSNNPYVDQFIHGRAEGPITVMANA
jgi:ABC-type transporter Mla maintaining outer membrane lipid asymmetry ATPase subunit MlaF